MFDLELDLDFDSRLPHGVGLPAASANARAKHPATRGDGWSTLLRLWLALALTLLAPGCAGTEVGNPADPADTTIEFAVYVSSVPGALRLSSGVELDEVWLFLDEIELHAADACEEEAEDAPERPGPVTVELVSGVELPGPVELETPQGAFCRLDLEVRKGELAELPAGSPLELEEVSVLVRGHAADGRPFELRSDLSQHWRLDAMQDFALGAGRHRLVVAFAVETWFVDVDLASADGDASIVIDEENNREILRAFEDSLGQSARLMRDGNRDGVIDRDEEENPLARGSVPSELP